MPSAFPGMDPFIEGHEWEDFHAEFITSLRAALVPGLRPEYLVRAEKRVYVEHPYEDRRLIRPDLTIVRPTRRSSSSRRRTSTSSTAVLEPVECTFTGPYEVSEKYLVIRRLGSSEVVTVIELLSPGNKRHGSEGHAEYLSKRDDVLRSRTHLVEIDLLRGGDRLPTVESLPAGDFYAFVCRAPRRLHVDVYGWPLAHQLPTIPIPLSSGDREVSLDLQTVFDNVYDRAGYDYSLEYDCPVEPPVDKATAKWIREVLKSRRVAR